jgi:hypothetical protein
VGWGVGEGETWLLLSGGLTAAREERITEPLSRLRSARISARITGGASRVGDDRHIAGVAVQRVGGGAATRVRRHRQVVEIGILLILPLATVGVRLRGQVAVVAESVEPKVNLGDIIFN